MNKKKCSSCQDTKSLDQFHKNKGTESGYAHDCKECRKSYYQENKEIIKHKHLMRS